MVVFLAAGFFVVVFFAATVFLVVVLFFAQPFVAVFVVFFATGILSSFVQKILCPEVKHKMLDNFILIKFFLFVKCFVFNF